MRRIFSPLRRALEWASAWMRFPRKLPARFGGNPVYVSPVASLGYLVRSLSRMDPGLLNCAEKYVASGMTVWDVGASVGLFTFAAAHRAGAQGLVVAIEPDPLMCGLLARSAVRQAPTSARVCLVGLAVSDVIGMTRFHTALRSRAANYLDGFGSSQTGGVKWSTWLLAVDLDFLAGHLPPPNVIKLDVEGAELQVLQGAKAVLRRYRPTIICEVASNVATDITDLLRGLDYALFDGDSGEPVSVARWSTVAVPNGGSEACN